MQMRASGEMRWSPPSSVWDLYPSLACGNPLGRVGETRSPEPTEQQPAPQREPWPAPGALPRAALLGNSPGLSKPEAGAVPRGLEEGQEAGWGVRDVHAALPCARGWEAKTATRIHAPPA